MESLSLEDKVEQGGNEPEAAVSQSRAITRIKETEQA
jgi:hypothetical protein